MKTKREKRETRHRRVRKKLVGTPERPRLCVYRSLKHMYAQIVDDTAQCTLVSVSTVEPGLRGQIPSAGNIKGAAMVGKLVAERALQIGLKRVVFDRGGYIYHGRVKALAEAAREGGLDF